MVGFKVKFYWYQIGSGDFLHAFFSTVAYNLENMKWGSRFPVIMKELYQGHLPKEHVDAAIGELAVISAELRDLSPDHVIWDIEDLSKQPPWGNDISEDITDLSNYFVTSDGEDFLTILLHALEKAKDPSVTDIEFCSAEFVARYSMYYSEALIRTTSNWINDSSDIPEESLEPNETTVNGEDPNGEDPIQVKPLQYTGDGFHLQIPISGWNYSLYEVAGSNVYCWESEKGTGSLLKVDFFQSGIDVVLEDCRLQGYAILLRNASITTYVIARFSALVISLSAIITFHLSLAAIMAVGSSMVKSTSSYTSSYYNSTISLFKEHFVSSSASICWIIVNYLFGLLLIASIIWLIIVSTPRKFRVPLIVLLYFFIFFGVQRSSSWYHPALFIFNMIILSNALPYNLFPWSMLIFLLTTGLILFLLCKRWWTIYRW